MQEWDEQLGAALREAEMFEARAGRALLQLNAVRGAVSELFEAAECSMQAAQQVLDSGAISASNLMQYLGFVEQSIDQLLRVSMLGFQPFDLLRQDCHPIMGHKASLGPMLPKAIVCHPVELHDCYKKPSQ